MCGIIYVKRLDGKRASRMINKRYRNQKSRGKEGFGYVAIDDGYVTNFVKAEEEKQIMDAVLKESVNEILFHHRYPTSTPNYWQCAHPILVTHPSLKHNYYVVHNGVITNEDVLHDKHMTEGFIYNTKVVQKVTDCWGTVIEDTYRFNDSEALAIELAKDLDGEQKGIDQVRGTIAFIALQVNKETKQTTKIFFGRNFGNPLKIDIDENYICLSSEGKGVDAKEHELHAIDLVTVQAEVPKPYKVGTSYWTGSGTTTSYSHLSGRKDYKDYDADGVIDYMLDNDDYPRHGPFAQPRIGFTTPKEVLKEKGLVTKNDQPIIVAPTDLTEEEQQQYYELIMEREETEAILRRTDLSDNERVEWEQELYEINARLTTYDNDWIQRALKEAQP